MPRPVRIAETPPRFSLRVQSVDHLADEVYRIRTGRHPSDWVPGDCVTVHAPGADSGSPYSFSGSPESDGSEFWVRKFPQGRVSGFLTERKPGDMVDVSPPFGWFRPLEPAKAPKIYIATGTGIAPFLSALSSSRMDDVQVLWGMRRELPIPDGMSHMNLQRCISREDVAGTHQGRVTALVADLEITEDTHIYLCGLDDMIREVSDLLRSKGVPDAHLHSECFFTSSSSAS